MIDDAEPIEGKKIYISRCCVGSDQDSLVPPPNASVVLFDCSSASAHGVESPLKQTRFQSVHYNIFMRCDEQTSKRILRQACSVSFSPGIRWVVLGAYVTLNDLSPCRLHDTLISFHVDVEHTPQTFPNQTISDLDHLEFVACDRNCHCNNGDRDDVSLQTFARDFGEEFSGFRGAHLKVAMEETFPNQTISDLDHLEFVACDRNCHCNNGDRDDVSLQTFARDFGEEFSGFRGAHLKVAMEEYRPFVFKEQVGEDFVYRGIDVELINVLAEKLNFTYSVVPSVDGLWGGQDPNGTWDGMIGMLMRQEVDIAASGISMTLPRLKVVDFTYPHWTEPSAVAVKLRRHKWNYFVDPLQTSTWLLYLSLPLLLAAGLLAMDLIQTAQVGKRRWVLKARFNAYCFEFLRCICNQGYMFVGESIHSRCLQASLWFCVVVITAAYTSNLTASLTVPKVPWPFEDLRGLSEDSEYEVLLVRGTVQEEVFKEASNNIYRAIWDKVDQTTFEALSDVNEVFQFFLGSRSAFIADYSEVVMHVREQKDCVIEVLSETFNPTGISIALPKNAVYKKQFDKIILELQQSGILNVWYEQSVYPDQCSFRRQSSHMSPVTFSDVSYVFLYVFGGGLSVSFAFFLLEFLVQRFRSLSESAQTEPHQD
ncbi:hypothetical protein CAPTEDRAFT_185470 [Capitella teleta]|uniref:Ionotropic glutamate receptor L-glutamate and glycine-binding domain-containing protein n=1 Tax=Capitella teleta TaxID=283909 RepID=R7VCD4_CAPTE|nr:hypothetical protein CAPTEDRAFT_185470 [Capitella teleta]|eukprot:ELU16508.1 hypothetical protein CAPTEDRAFT_185470 [Capitella teleta]